MRRRTIDRYARIALGGSLAILAVLGALVWAAGSRRGDTGEANDAVMQALRVACDEELAAARRTGGKVRSGEAETAAELAAAAENVGSPREMRISSYARAAKRGREKTDACTRYYRGGMTRER